MAVTAMAPAGWAVVGRCHAAMKIGGGVSSFSASASCEQGHRAFPVVLLPAEFLARNQGWFRGTDSLYVALGARQISCVMFARRLLSPAADSGNAPEKFEELLGRLEKIVADMENAELPLEKLLESYEEGMRLVKACGDRLADAEQKVEILSRAVSADAAKTPAATEAAHEKKDEIRLF